MSPQLDWAYTTGMQAFTDGFPYVYNARLRHDWVTQAWARPAPTPWVLLLGRTLVDGEADLAEVHALQAQYRLTPLSLWGKPGAAVPERRDVYAQAEAARDPLGPWKTLNAMLAENPPPPRSATGLPGWPGTRTAGSPSTCSPAHPAARANRTGCPPPPSTRGS